MLVQFVYFRLFFLSLKARFPSPSPFKKDVPWNPFESTWAFFLKGIFDDLDIATFFLKFSDEKAAWKSKLKF